MNKIQDELELVFPTPEYKTQVEEYLQEFFDNGEYEIAGDGGLDRIKNFDEFHIPLPLENNGSRAAAAWTAAYRFARRVCRLREYCSAARCIT